MHPVGAGQSQSSADAGWSRAPGASGASAPRLVALPAPGRTRVRSARHHQSRWWAWRAGLGDVLAAAAAAGIAYFTRFELAGPAPKPLPYEAVTVALVVLWPAVLAFCRAYDHRAALFGVEEARSVARAVFVLIALTATAHFAFRLDLARGYVVVFLPVLAFLTATWRWALRVRVRARHRKGLGRHRAVALGPAADVVRLVRQLRARPTAVELVAVVCENGGRGDLTAALRDVPRLGSRDEIATMVASSGEVDLLLRAGQPDDDEIWELAAFANALDLDLAIAPDHTDATNLAFSYLPLGATPMLLVENRFLAPTHRILKDVSDRVLAAITIVLLSPVFLAIALVILVRDGRPVIFRQERIGRGGVPFRVVKFRTMVPDAEQRLVELADRNEASGPLFKLRNDPRITRTGAILRKWSLDELPQLFNVLGGSMSLVGPRPPLPSEVRTYDERTARRLLVKPGLTGLWQVEGRSDLPWDEAVYLDIAYVDHWSPLLDIAILLRTVRAVIRQAGAY